MVDRHDNLVVDAVSSLVVHVLSQGVPKTKLSAALAGIGIRMALEESVDRLTVHELVDDIIDGIEEEKRGR